MKGVQHPRGLSQHSFPEGAQGGCRGCVKLGPIHRGRMLVHEGRSQAFGVDRSEHRLHGRGPVRSFGRPAGPKLQSRPGRDGRSGQKLPPAEVAFICERHRFHRLPGLQSDLVRGNPHPSNLVGPGRDHPTPKSCPLRQKAGLEEEVETTLTDDSSIVNPGLQIGLGHNRCSYPPPPRSTISFFVPLRGYLFSLLAFPRSPSRTPFESFPIPWSPFAD